MLDPFVSSARMADLNGEMRCYMDRKDVIVLDVASKPKRNLLCWSGFEPPEGHPTGRWTRSEKVRFYRFCFGNVREWRIRASSSSVWYPGAIAILVNDHRMYVAATWQASPPAVGSPMPKHAGWIEVDPDTICNDPYREDVRYVTVKSVRR
jgi:hypothetical protein